MRNDYQLYLRAFTAFLGVQPDQAPALGPDAPLSSLVAIALASEARIGQLKSFDEFSEAVAKLLKGAAAIAVAADCKCEFFALLHHSEIARDHHRDLRHAMGHTQRDTRLADLNARLLQGEGKLTPEEHVERERLSADYRDSVAAQERTLILDMVRSMIDSPDALDGFSAVDAAGYLLGCITRGLHHSAQEQLGKNVAVTKARQVEAAEAVRVAFSGDDEAVPSGIIWRDWARHLLREDYEASFRAVVDPLAEANLRWSLDALPTASDEVLRESLTRLVTHPGPARRYGLSGEHGPTK